MILGVGIDTCPIQRIADVLERQGDAFEQRVFTPAERAYADCKIKYDRLAARWAAKEAAIKALGGVSGIDWQDMEIRNGENGAPTLTLSGGAGAHAATLGVKKVFVSLSHAGGQAVAVVILEG